MDITYGGEKVEIISVTETDAILKCKDHITRLSHLERFNKMDHPSLKFKKEKLESKHDLYRDQDNVHLGCLCDTEAVFIQTLKKIQKECQRRRTVISCQ